MFSIHPATIPVFLLFFIFEKTRIYCILYIFVFLHELSHALISTLLGEKPERFYLFPWGCMLSINISLPRWKRFFILIAGCLFNFAMFFADFYPRENLSLAVFNMMPIIPLDGGMILNLFLPSYAFIFSVCFILSLFLLCIYLHIFPIVPIILTLVFIIGEKQRADKNISDKVIRHFRQK